MLLLSSTLLLNIFGLMWEIDTPEHLGMDQAKLEEARDYALTGGGSGCVIRGGRMIISWGDQQQKYDLYSTTKSIGGIALALAIMDGKVNLDDRMVDHLSTAGVPPESNKKTGWLEKITLLHLATHTAGFEKTRGWCELRFEPGTGWLYSDGGTNWLADCLTVAYEKDLLDLMMERVFDPLGITVGNNRNGDEDLFWGFNNLDRPKELNGIPRRPFNAGIHANVQAMAKIGYLHLRRGRWENQQIVSESLIDMARTTIPGVLGLPVKEDTQNRFVGASNHYGILWWNNNDGALSGVSRDAYWSWGLKESLIVVIPSLDLVIARAGRDGWQSNNWGSGYAIIEPFVRPICESVAYSAPYPPSNAITSIAWAPEDSIICPARKADNWPITWADDGNQYTAWGDGWGFATEYPRETKLSLGFCVVSGDPPDVTGVNIPSPDVQKGGGANGKKASGMLMVDGVLYMWVRNIEHGTGQQSQLAWSADHAKNWTWSDWKFEELGYPCFLNFGRNYEGAHDDYVYVYSPNTPSAYYETDEVILARVPKGQIRLRESYEFFRELDSDGNPIWTTNISERGAVFRFPGGCNRMDVTYNPAIGRYMMVMRSRPKMSSDAHLPDKSSAHGVNQFSIYDAPEPWGPWTTVYYSEQWEGTPLKDLKYWQGWGESSHIPSKWISSDGKTIHLLFAGGPGGFSIRKAKLTMNENNRNSKRGEHMDTRWRNLPHTDTEFVPKHYNNLVEWEDRRSHLRNQILWAAGLWPMPEKTPLNPIISGRITHDDYTMEKVCFESYPGLYVCGNLYRPLNTTPGGHPAVLNPHGHAATGRLHDDEIASYQARCISFARMGCVAFMWDMVDYNDSSRQLNGHYEDVTYWNIHNEHWKHDRHQKSLWNIGSFGLQLWNSIRALDFLSSLPEVDDDRLACTGESGGGTQTFMLYAVDDRLKVAAPVCMVSSYMQGGCNCENAPGLRIDTHNTEIGAMMAPKPLMLVSATGDWTKNTPDVEYPAIRSVYELYGATDKLKSAHFDAKHGYNLDMREAVYPWFAKWLSLPYTEDFKEPVYQTEKAEDILSFTEGIPEGAIDTHEKLIRQLIKSTEDMLASYKPTDLKKYSENHRVLGEGLKLSVGARSFGTGDVEYQHRKSANLSGVPCEEGILVGKKRGIQVPVWVFRPEVEESGVSTLLVHGKGKSVALVQMDLINELLASGNTVYAIDVFGMGDAVDEQNPEEPRGSMKYFTTFNRTDDAERVYDIALAMSYLRNDDIDVLNVIGVEDAGPYVMIAGAIMGQRDLGLPEIQFAVDANQFDTSSEDTYLQKLYIPGILRAGGLKNAAALLAPNSLLLHNTAGLFDTLWMEDAYGLKHPDCDEPLLIVKEEAQDDAALVEFLTK